MPDTDALIGPWVHIHEEDDAEARVFRRPGSPLPPSRGRLELDVARDLTVKRIGPGADDRPQARASARIGFGSILEGTADYLRVLAVEGDTMRIAKE